jgi:mercuric ion transport protein
MFACHTDAAAMAVETERALQSTSRGSDCSATQTRLARWTTAAGLVSSFGVCAACCLLPFVLISLGITSAWVGTLDRLAPFKWFFVIATMALLGYGFYLAYFKSKPACAGGSKCRTCAPNTLMRLGLWAGLLIAIGGLLFERFESLFV